MAIKSHLTQSLVNTYPVNSSIRNDEESLGFQLFNVIAKNLEDLYKQSRKIYNNMYIGTSCISDIDLYYYYQLPRDYEFVKEDDDNTELLYTAPDVIGVVDGITHTLTIAEDNNIENFWYKSVPDSISLNQTNYNSHLLASGFALSSPFSPPVSNSGILHIPNKVYVEINSGVSFLGIQEDTNQVRKTTVQIEGKTRNGLDMTEELIFLSNGIQSTINDYYSIVNSGIRIYGVNDLETTDINVTSALFNKQYYPDFYNLDVSKENKLTNYFWGIDTTLNLYKYEIDDIELIIDGFDNKVLLLEQELLDTNNNLISNPVDLTLEPYTNNIWVTTPSKLYLYTTDLPYPNLKLFNSKSYDAYATLEFDTYYYIRGDTIYIHYHWKRPITGLVAYKVNVIKPDGTQYSLVGGYEVAYNSSWIYLDSEPLHKNFAPTDTFVVDQLGTYLYTLETKFTDDATFIDQKCILVCSQVAKAEYTYLSAGINTNIIGIDIDSENKLWALDSNNYKYQIDFHHDIMLIDFNKKILYFREPYDYIQLV